MSFNLNYKNLFNYLIDTAVCTKYELTNIKVDTFSSKNFNWVIELSENKCKLIIKQYPNYNGLDGGNRIRKEWYIYNFLQSSQDLAYPASLTPELLSFDESSSILICKYLNDYITLDSYYINQKFFPSAIAEWVGITLAKLHSETMNSQRLYTFTANFKECKLSCQLPYPDYISDYLVNRIEPENLKKIPVQSWNILSMFQHSQDLRKVATELVFHHRHYCLTHNNIQFNKILIPRDWEKLLSDTEDYENTSIKLTDWEAYSWGDPACDLGQAIAGYFSFWLNSIVVYPEIKIEQSLRLATIPLEVVRPSIVAMANAYLKTFPKILEAEPEFLKRVVQFAGFGLIHQLLVEFQISQEILSSSRWQVNFSIATQLLRKPEKFLAI